MIKFMSTAPATSSISRTVLFLVAIVFFFVGTLLASFFGVIVMISNLHIPGDMAPNVFMVGLVPPSVLSVLVYMKVFSRFL
jgi:hypothetical protein